MSTADLFSDIPEADPREVPVSKSTRRRSGSRITKLGNTDEPEQKKTSFNAHQRKWFDSHDWVYYLAEKRNPHGGKSMDMWTCIDWVAFCAAHGAVLVQTTDHTSISKRFAKIKAAPEIRRCLAFGGRVEIHAWEKIKNRWQVRRVRIVLDGDTLRREDVTE